MAVSAVAWPLLTAVEIHVKVPLQVSSDDEIQLPVIVDVNPCCASGPAGAGDSRLGGYVRKSSVSIVVVKRVVAITRDIEIFEAIIVVVPDCHTHSVGVALHS